MNLQSIHLNRLGSCRSGIILAGVGCLVGLLISPPVPQLRFLCAALGTVLPNAIAHFTPKAIRGAPLVATWLIRISTPKRSWFQFRLPAIFLLTVVCSLGALAWSRFEPYRRDRLQQQELIAAVKSLGGTAGGESGPTWYRYRAAIHVNLNGRAITDDDVAWLLQFPGASRIQSLTIERTLITDEALHHVARRMPALVILDVAGCKLTDEAIGEVARLPALRYLDVTRCDISDTGIRELRHSKRLERLDAGGTKLTDKSLVYLMSLPLLFLVVDETLITESAVNEFRSRLPHCKVQALGLQGQPPQPFN